MPAPLRLLITEDEAVLAPDPRATVLAEGYGVAGIAATGPQALALFTQHPVGGVLCDLHLPGPWGGLETARRLRAGRPVPRLYLAAPADQPTLNEAPTTAPAAYLRAALALALRLFARPLPAAPALSADALTHDTILLLEADNTSPTLRTPTRKYALRLALGRSRARYGATKAYSSAPTSLG